MSSRDLPKGNQRTPGNPNNTKGDDKTKKLGNSTNIQEQVKMSLYYTTILLNYQIYIYLLYN